MVFHKILNRFRSLFSLCFGVLLIQLQVQAQRDAFVTSFYDAKPDRKVLCRLIYNDTTGKSNFRFKKINWYSYKSPDSLFRAKSLLYKWTVTFDGNGNPVTLIKQDVKEGEYDSTIIGYDNHYNRISEITFRTDKTTEQYKFDEGEYFTWNEKEKMSKDSISRRNNDIKNYNDKEFNTFCYYYKYDQAGNLIKIVMVDNSDTNVFSSEYDAMNREITINNKLSGYSKREFKKYNSNNQVIDNISINTNGDKLRLIKSFDDKKREIMSARYVGNTCESRDTTIYDKDGGRQWILNYFGLKRKDGSCANQSKTVTTYDKNNNELLDVYTSFENGKQRTVTTTHKYEFTGDGKILSDTITKATASDWQWGRVIEVHLNKYDAHGNRIYEEIMGGTQTTYNSKQTWAFNEKDKPLEHDIYSTCSDDIWKKVIDIYYPDGVTLKEEITVLKDSEAKLKFGKDSRRMEEIEHRWDSYLKTYAEYEE